MEKIDEIYTMLSKAMPLLEQFADWKTQEAEREKQAEQERTESQKEFEKWLAQRQAQQAQESADAAELQKHFFGCSEWEKERLISKRF